ncbi:peptidylprolyl isomerase [Nafulsella turpanensis]|uniref:peptidylprolyl isomerase n=1 Tax=Nafulsella turpanensis TaxID=1265690 RepID=UPI0003719777
MSLKFIPNKTALAFLFLFLCGSQSLYAQSRKQVVDEIIVKVDDYIALKSELDLSYLDMVSRGQFSGNIDRCDVLRQIVQNKLMLAKAEIDSISVSDEQVSAELDARMQYMVAQLGSEEEIERYYKKPLSQFKAELQDKMREQLLIKEVSRSITSDVEITPAEVKRFFHQLPADSLPFFSTEVTVGHIVKLPEVSEEQKNRVRERLNEVRQKIISGEATFAEMAKKYSEDPGSAATGGELGFRKRGELVPEYEATALRMNPGDISKPVESQFGFHLIQLIERRGNTFNSRHILIKPNSSNLDISEAEQYLDSLRTEIVEGSIDFSIAAKEYSDDAQTNSSGGYFLNQEGGNRISVEELDPSIFFVIDTMEVGTISKPLPYRTADGKDAVRIIYYENKVRPHRANLKDDYQKIQAAALMEKKNKIVAKWFEDAVDEVYIDIDEEYNHCNILE